MVLVAAWASSEKPPRMQDFVDYCAFVGASLTGNHWLGVYCRNNITDVFDYNYTWYLCPFPWFLLFWACSGPTRLDDRINLDLCVGNNDGQLVAYDK